MRESEHCWFCEAELNDGETFVTELELLHWKEVEPVWEDFLNCSLYFGEPLRICTACRESVEQNVADLQAEREAESTATQRYWMVVRLLILALAAFVIAVLAFEGCGL